MIALLAAWIAILSLWSIFSYSLTDHNLTLTSWQGYWVVQNWLWDTFFSNRFLLATTYGALIFSWFAAYALLLKKIWITHVSTRWTLGVLVLSSGILVLSYNALSHDVFNYIFNARMVLEYSANPHQSVALDFPNDLWTRFMHNTHTPAPYGYGWTAISLLPGWLGSDRFTATWVLFRVFGIASLFFLADILIRLMKLRKVSHGSFWLAVVLLNPLVLIEVISNSHNDLWMMVPALWSLYLLEKYSSKKLVAVSLLLLLFSITIKLATVLLLPLWIVLAFGNFAGMNKRLEEAVTAWWPTIAALSLFATFFTVRSTYFHPWYLLWVLVFLPFIKNKQLQILIIFFSSSSLLRYIPWLYTGEYTADVMQWRIAITWGIPIILWMLYRKIQMSRIGHYLAPIKKHA